jgi:hypothetical protein
MGAIERENPTLKGVLPRDYARPSLDKVRLGGLVDIISNIGFNESAPKSKDVLGRVLYKYNAPEIDPIFPRSVLRKKIFDHSQIEHPANFWILAKGKNANKSDKHPADYFADVPEKEMKRALIKRDMLDYRRFTSFLEDRSEATMKTISKEIGLSATDFQSSS